MTEREAFGRLAKQVAKGCGICLTAQEAKEIYNEISLSQASATDEGRERVEVIRGSDKRRLAYVKLAEFGQIWDGVNWVFDGEAERDTTPPQPACSQKERDMDLLKECTDPSTVFYGPHECPNGCRATVCRVSLEQGGMIFNYPEGIIYPNTNWVQHVCKATPPQEVAAEPHIEIHKFIPPDDRWIIGKAAEEDNADVLAVAPEVAVPADDLSVNYRADFDPDAIVATLRQQLATAERENATLREWKASAMTQLAKAVALMAKLPMPKYWGWDVYDATVDYLETLRERNEELQKAVHRICRETYSAHIRALGEAALAPSAERKPEVKG